MDLETTVDDLAPRLLRYCLAKGGCPQLAEDTAQEALGALVDRWRRHGPPRSPEAFVFTVARRRGIRRALKRRLLRPLEALADRPDSGPDPAQMALERERLTELRQALGRLPGQDREVLLLSAAGELGPQEIARLLGISHSAAKMRLHRARRRLAALMEVSHGIV